MNIVTINNNVIIHVTTVQPPTLPEIPTPAVCTTRPKRVKIKEKCSSPICISDNLLPKRVLVLIHVDSVW